MILSRRNKPEPPPKRLRVYAGYKLVLERSTEHLPDWILKWDIKDVEPHGNKILTVITSGYKGYTEVKYQLVSVTSIRELVKDRQVDIFAKEMKELDVKSCYPFG